MKNTTRIFTLSMAVATWCLLFVGAMVTSTNSGLSVPDWPTTFGQNMFLYPLSQMKGGVFFEHGHRLFASAIGFLALVNALFLGGRVREPLLRWTSYFALFLVIFQGVLGGITVRMKLPMWVSASHGGTAQLFFLTTILIAVLASQSWGNPLPGQRLKPAGFAWADPKVKALLVFLCLGYAQIWFGALMRHSYAGLAIPTFPMAFGGWIPSFWNFGMVMHFIHTRIMPILLTGALVWIFRMTWSVSIPQVKWGSRMLSGLFAIQILLGATVIWSFKAPLIASLHLAIGAAVLGCAFYMLLFSGRFSQSVPGTRREAAFPASQPIEGVPA
jgi:heme a synthase